MTSSDAVTGWGSFDQFVAARSVPLQRFAYLVTGHAEDARDAVQDALVGLFPRWARVVAAGDPEAYVRRSIMNAHVSRWRRVRRESSWDPAWLDGAAPDVDMTDAAMAAALCAELAPRQRAAVVLRFYEGCAYDEIAEVCDTTPGAARVLVHRALATLRTRLEACDD